MWLYANVSQWYQMSKTLFNLFEYNDVFVAGLLDDKAHWRTKLKALKWIRVNTKANFLLLLRFDPNISIQVLTISPDTHSHCRDR